MKENAINIATAYIFRKSWMGEIQLDPTTLKFFEIINLFSKNIDYALLSKVLCFTLIQFMPKLLHIIVLIFIHINKKFLIPK